MADPNTPVSAAHSPLRISHPLLQVVGWSTLLLFSSVALVAGINQRWLAALLLLAFALLGALLLLTTGVTEITDDHVTHIAPLGARRISWADVEHVVFDPGGRRIVFSGRERQLVIPGMRFWSGQSKHAAIDLIDQRLRQLQIPVRNAPWGPFQRSRDSRER